ncbi:ABC transporter ATP-binding protein [Sandarakinorhabdus sp. DWP1-3-1]|uniref:ABC transporter ATP-binding protein n=1 Tax=Sandarakinorhabdus sp. DWP1-3-1 TaxID=2804627 RepID=UPI003CE7AA5B
MSLVATALARPPMLAPTDIALHPGALVGLVGPNGAGKTTLLRVLAGLGHGPGTVTLEGTPLAALPARQRATRLAWLPADRDVAWPMRARDVVVLGLAGGSDDGAVADALTRADAAAFADRRVDTLSTGERARVLLARALVNRPAVLLLDEPTANLDPGHRLHVMDLLRAEATRGAIVLVALHDLDLAMTRCDRLLLVADGALVADGPPAAVLDAGRLAAIFGVARSADGWVTAGRSAAP